MEKAKGKNNNVLKILKRPIVKLAILLVIIIGVIALIANNAGSKKSKDSTDLVGYQRLINVTDDTYTFLDLEGKSKTYSGYSSMNDFYYDCSNHADNSTYRLRRQLSGADTECAGSRNPHTGCDRGAERDG